ncbi:MAG: hypothetical protein A2008_10985 [Candidatus Wallbacteria bacterium GWC2_49_35]|uniref:Tetratricopeptide repeat protein n=1 Tax=Candidatus Wallbacteria bacterium GWC2_49_35 TaxID=1817813 RepID=A0A1F7WF95_9BACT|nr:MAG: hypothetical protein A2008_10985 [Candidatus Wallbacteria bacterium GWC2_49_35]
MFNKSEKSLVLSIKTAAALLCALLFIAAAYGDAFAVRAQAERLCEEGIKLFQLGKYAEAETKFSSAIGEDGSYGPSYYYMARIYEQRNNHDEALSYIKKALSNIPHEDIYKNYVCEINNNMAIEAIKNNNIDRAYKLYYSNLDLVPYHLPTYNRLAALAIKKGDYNDALLQCNKALEKNSAIPPNVRFDSNEQAMLHTHMALCFFELKNYSRAINEIETAKNTKDSSYVQKYYKKIMGDENPVVSELKKADAAFEAGDFKTAREGYDKVISLYPNSKTAVEKLSIMDAQARIENVIAEADLLASNNQIEEAIDKYNQVLAADPTRVVLKDKIKELKAKAELIQKQAAASIRGKSNSKSTDSIDIDAKLRQLIEKSHTSVNPDQAYELKFTEAEGYYSKQEYDKALEIYHKLIEDREDFRPDEINKRIRSIYASRGEFFIEYYNMAVPKLYVYLAFAAVIALIIWMYFGGQIAVMMKPDPMKNYKDGVDYLDKEKYESAIASFEKALNNNFEPLERARIKAKLSLCYFKIKNYDKCIKVSLEVLDVDPKNEVVHGYLGNSFLEKNATNERAISEYKLLLRKQKDDKRLLTTLCTQFIKEDNLSQEAIDVYQKIFTIDSKDKNVRRMLCDAFVRSNDKTDIAIKVYESILSDEPHRAEVKLMLISAKFSRKNFDECVMLCEELFEKGVIENITLEYYTNSYFKLDKKSELYQKYVDLSRKFPDNQILKSYVDKIQSQLVVERLTGGGGPAVVPAGSGSGGPVPAASQQQGAPGANAPSAPAVNICRNCAHMNPAGLKTCEHCGAAM